MFTSNDYDIDYELFIDDKFVYSFPCYGSREVDLGVDIQRYLDFCVSEADGTCLMPVRFLSEDGLPMVPVHFEIVYRVRDIDISAGMRDYSENDCIGSCTAPVRFYVNGSGSLSVYDLKVYRGPFIEENLTPQFKKEKFAVNLGIIEAQ